MQTISKFIVYSNETGEIVSTGSCPSEHVHAQARTGCSVLVGEADPKKDIVDLSTKKLIKGGKPQVDTVVSYSEIRKSMYPSTADQLDMLWHSMNDGTLPIAEPFYSSIKFVKDAVPKSDEYTFNVGSQ